MTEQTIARKDAKNLIVQTVQEFQESVMLPLDKNIKKHVKASNTNALRLHEQFSAFSNAALHMYDIFSSLKALSNSQLTQFLNLCREVATAFKLPVQAKMPQGEVIDIKHEVITPIELPFMFRLERSELGIRIVWYIDDGQPRHTSPNSFSEFNNTDALKEWLRKIARETAVPIRPQIEIVYANFKSSFFLNDDVFNFFKIPDGYEHMGDLLLSQINNYNRYNTQYNIPEFDINDKLYSLIEPSLQYALNKTIEILTPASRYIEQRLGIASDWVISTFFSKGKDDAAQTSDLQEDDSQNTSGDTSRRPDPNASIDFSGSNLGVNFNPTGNNDLFVFTGLNLDEFYFPGINASTLGADITAEVGVRINTEPFNVSSSLKQRYRINDDGFQRDGQLTITFSLEWRF